MSPAEKVSKSKPKRQKIHVESEWNCKIRELRESLGLSMQEVTKATGIQPSSQSLAERGKDLNLSTAYKLAKFYGKTIEELWPDRVGEE
jgi:transcriptional regulator with XRE-family HTH domain